MGSNFAAQASNVTTFDVFSNYGNSISCLGGISEVYFYESVLDHTVRAKIVMVDSGIRFETPGVGSIENQDGLKLTAGEKVELVLEDNFGQTISCTGEYHLRIKEVSDIVEDTQFMAYTINLYSKECIDNELKSNRVTKRYDLKIVDSVRKILLEDCIKTPKGLDADSSINDYNFLGHVQKPFYVITDLAKRCVPNAPSAEGILAGYLFYEISRNGGGSAGGFKFKSIDLLFAQSPIRKLIYNDTTGKPSEYDHKILTYSFDNTIDIQKQMLTGGMFQSTLKTLNPYNWEYIETDFNASAQFSPDTNGGIEQPLLASDLGVQSQSTREDFTYPDWGVLPFGENLSAQLENSKIPNYTEDQILRQSYMRYNNLFATRLTVTIPGDFGIHAGNLVHCDFPEVSDKTDRIVSQRKSGLYMIVDVCHFIKGNPGSTYTKMNLVRESLGRKPF